MLAIVSFIVQSYGAQEVGPVLSQSGGITMANMTATSAMASNLVSAAGFLATMVPLISWGLVKGSIAFTEFITHGIGQSFAAGAAQTMATGNVSLDNFSMDNANMFKWSAAASQAMGSQGTTGYLAGVNGMVDANWQGQKFSANGGAMNPVQSNQNSAAVSQALSRAEAIKEAEARQQAITTGLQDQLANTTAELRAFGINASVGKDGKLTFTQGSGTGDAATAGRTASAGANAAAQRTAKAGLDGGADVKGGGKGVGPGGHIPLPAAHGGAEAGLAASKTNTRTRSAEQKAAEERKVHHDENVQAASSASGSAGQGASSGRQAQIQALESKAASIQDSITKSQQREHALQVQYNETLHDATVLSQSTTGAETFEQGDAQVHGAPEGLVSGVDQQRVQSDITAAKRTLVKDGKAMDAAGAKIAKQQAALQSEVQRQHIKDNSAIDAGTAATRAQAAAEADLVNGAKVLNDINVAGKNINSEFATLQTKMDASMAKDPSVLGVISQNKAFLAGGLGIVGAAEVGGTALSWVASKLGKSEEAVKGMVASEEEKVKGQIAEKAAAYEAKGFTEKEARKMAARDILKEMGSVAAKHFGEREVKGLAKTAAADAIPGVGEAVATVVTAVNAGESVKDAIGLAIAAKELADD